MDMGRVVVIGGANLDVVGHSFAPLVPSDSNPGYVRRSAGGVGRNIAENLARLGVSTTLITAFGQDANAEYVAEKCRSVGIDLSRSLMTELPGSLYLAILDDGGEMALALSDMRPLDRLTPRVLEERADVIDEAGLVVAEANLPYESLEWLAQRRTRLLVDSVSTRKAEKLKPLLARFDALKCTAEEALVMLGRQPGPRDPATEREREVPDRLELARALNSIGVESAFVTAGDRGTYYAADHRSGHLPAPRTTVANTTGAGDAFAAGVAAGLLMRGDAQAAARIGTRLAGVTLASEHTVSEHVSPELLFGEEW